MHQTNKGLIMLCNLYETWLNTVGESKLNNTAVIVCHFSRPFKENMIPFRFIK